MNNNNNSNLNYLNKSKKFFKSIKNVKLSIILLLVVIISIVIYYVVSVYNDIKDKKALSPMIIGSPINAFPENPIIINAEQLPISKTGMKFSMNMWIYISNWDWGFDKEKFIINRQDVANNNLFYIKLDSVNNSIISGIKTSANSSFENLEECKIQNFPLQKWVNYSYVLNNRTANIYIDGKLINSCELKGIPNLNDIYSTNMILFNNKGYYGQLSKFQYFADSLVNNDITLIYKEGPFISKSAQTNFLDDEVDNQYKDYIKNLQDNNNNDNFLKIIGVQKN